MGESPLALQGYLDAATRVVDRHLADVVSNSWDTPVFTYSPADVAAWNLAFQQGALEGIGFDYAAGDGGSVGPDDGLPTSAMFPSSDPWATGVGGTSLAIGKNGTAVADYPWGDNVTQVNGSGTGYTPPLPGTFQAGSGGRSPRCSPSLATRPPWCPLRWPPMSARRAPAGSCPTFRPTPEATS